VTDVREAVASGTAREPATEQRGAFIWYELMTGDPEGAKRFYDAVVGWNIGEPTPQFQGYRMIEIPSRFGGGFAGGVLPLTDEMRRHGARPTWLGYVGVNDVDAAVVAIERAGGKTLMPAFDISEVGRIAMVADPQGVPFYVMRGASEESSDVFSPDRIGRCTWNELLTSDLGAARRFYVEQFGWTLGDVMPMGPMGDYQFIEHGGRPTGAMFAPPGGQPAWRFCFRTESLERSIDEVNKGGGTIHFGPAEVPTGGRIIQATDLEGVFFMLIEGGQ
jgi:predicted enzyme related to lactoylglutathione lyase